jgi:hypothetical protein
VVFGVQLVVHTHQVLVGHGTQLGASFNHISGLILIQANEKPGMFTRLSCISLSLKRY